MQYLAPMSASWLAETSPVYAPFSYLLTSWPPAATLQSLPALTIAGIITAGVHSTISQVRVLGRFSFSSSIKGLISEASMFIFQLPAITVLRYFLFISISPSIQMLLCEIYSFLPPSGGRKDQPITYPAGRPRRAAPCLPGTPGWRRRRWKCG